MTITHIVIQTKRSYSMIKLESRKIQSSPAICIRSTLSKLTTCPIQFFRGAQPSTSKVRGAQAPAAPVVPTAMSCIHNSVHVLFSGENSCPPHPDMSKEGVLWFPDLTLPDYTGMLPVFLGLANLANIEVSYDKWW